MIHIFFWFGKICKSWWECVQIREQVCIMVKIILQNLEPGGGNVWRWRGEKGIVSGNWQGGQCPSAGVRQQG